MRFENSYKTELMIKPVRSLVQAIKHSPTSWIPTVEFEVGLPWLVDRFTPTDTRPLKGPTHKIDLKVEKFPLAWKIKPDVHYTIIKESIFTVKKEYPATYARMRNSTQVE